MDHDVDLRPGPTDDRRGLIARVLRPNEVNPPTRNQVADARSPTVLPMQERIDGLRRRLRAAARDVDHLWRDALVGQDFDLVTRSVDASQGVHRALLALDDDHFAIGSVAEGPDESCRSGRARPATS